MKKILLPILSLFLLVGFVKETWAASSVEEFTTPAGIKIRYRQDTTTPVICLNFSFQCGAVHDPDGKKGTAELLSSLMLEGTKSLSVEDLSAALQDDSISLGYSVSDDYFTGSLTTLRKNMDRAFALMKETFFESTFSPAGMDRAKKEILTLLAMEAEKPNVQVRNALQKSLFKGHPYADYSRGTPESIQKITVEDLRTFHDQFSKKLLIVSVAGNISKEEVIKKVDELFENLPDETSLKDIPIVTNPIEPKEIVKRAKIPQTVFAFVQKGLDYRDSSYLALHLLNKIVSERLRVELRDKAGLTYHVGMLPVAKRKAALWLGVCATKNERARDAVQKIKEQLLSIKESGFTQEEFDDAKAYLIGSFVLNFKDTPSISGALLGWMQHEYPVDYMEIRNKLMEKLTYDEIKKLAATLIDPDKMTFVMYGEPEGI